MADYLFVVGEPDGPYFSAFHGTIRVDADGKTEAGTLSGVGLSLLVNAGQAILAGDQEQPISLTVCLPPGPGVIAAGDGLGADQLQGQLSVHFRDARDGMPALCIAGPAARLSGEVRDARKLMNGVFDVGPCSFQASFGPQPRSASSERPSRSVGTGAPTRASTVGTTSTSAASAGTRTPRATPGPATISGTCSTSS